MAKPITLERSVACASDVCSIWNAIADTDRLNRVVGNDRLEVRPLDGESAARFLVRTNLGGFDVAYEEPPFEWEHMKRFTIERRMRSGPVELLRMEFRTEPEGAATTVHLRLTLVPRFAVLSPIVKVSGSLNLGKIASAVRALDGAIQRNELSLLGPRSPVDEHALGRALAALERRGAGDVCKRLADLVRTEADHAVAILRPYSLADEWGLDRRAVLGSFLLAVREGLLDLRWDLVCPSCRTGATSVSSLEELGEHGTCQLCELSFGLDLEDSVEAVFSPAPAVRKVGGGPYCTGGPARTPHVLSQIVLPARGKATLRAPEDAGRYRLFVRGGATLLVEVAVSAAAPGVAGGAADGAADVELDACGLGWPVKIAVAPGAAIRMTNARAEALHAKIERAAWARQAATARDVMMLPELRKDLTSQVLKPGVALKVGRVALLFSDLTGSTELYAQAGDAAAFRLVLDHFDVLGQAVAGHGGTVVKTIGDAVMAVFPDDRAALAAGVEMLSAFEAFRRAEPLHRQTHLKVGVFGGPCFAVTANRVLDYFGQTVNVAARLQGEAKSGELVAPTDLVAGAMDRGELAGASIVETYEARLKGVPEPIAVARVRIGEAAPAPRTEHKPRAA